MMTYGRFFSLMPATEKLFHSEPYLTECRATVLGVHENLVVFDKTIFYAESGGQDSDSGFVNKCKVIDVQKYGGDNFFIPKGDCIKINTYFVHVFEGNVPFSVGDEVELNIDWDKRYKIMQYHSLSHYLYAVVNEMIIAVAPDGDFPFTKGCHICIDSARFDYANSIPSEWIPVVEEKVNMLISSGVDITMTRFDGTDDIFIWSSSGISIPCGGTHVKNSSEIKGVANVKRKAKGKGNVRIYVELQDVA